MAAAVEGRCDTRFGAVADEFRRNLDDRGELGASVCVHLDGEPVVDLWGGVANADGDAPWLEDTMAVVFSATKGMAATCLHLLIDRGQLDPEAPVVRYWPEFGANGKEDVTVAMVMSHQAGLPFWQEEMPQGGMLDWDVATSMLAAQAPVWEPGTTHGYHAATLGYLEGEILRRIDGRTIGAFLREEIAGPLNADVWIGLPEAEHRRVATLVLGEADPTSAFYKKLMDEPGFWGWKWMTNSGGDISPESVNGSARRTAELPAHGGIANARGLARLYAPLSLDGAAGGHRLVSAERLPAMRNVRAASDCDVMLRLPTTFTLGYSKSWGARSLGAGSHVIIGEDAFGTPGMGGSIGFADAGARMSFGYVMNKHGGGVGLNDRGQALVDAAYRSVGFTSSDAGVWTR